MVEVPYARWQYNNYRTQFNVFAQESISTYITFAIYHNESESRCVFSAAFCKKYTGIVLTKNNCLCVGEYSIIKYINTLFYNLYLYNKEAEI